MTGRYKDHARRLRLAVVGPIKKHSERLYPRGPDGLRARPFTRSTMGPTALRHQPPGLRQHAVLRGMAAMPELVWSDYERTGQLSDAACAGQETDGNCDRPSPIDCRSLRTRPELPMLPSIMN
jgi:hypothetical protein